MLDMVYGVIFKILCIVDIVYIFVLNCEFLG